MDKLKIKYLQFIASFMIVLVVTIPIYSASVFAGLSYVGAKGSDGFDDYVNEVDYVEFEVVASLEGDEEIDLDQVWLA